MSDDMLFRGFSVTPKALIMAPDGVTDEIMIGLLHREGGCRYEFALRWREAHAPAPSTMRLEMYDEAVSALVEWPDFVAWLGTLTPERRYGRQVTSTSVEDVAAALIGMGFEDRSR